MNELPAGLATEISGIVGPGALLLDTDNLARYGADSSRLLDPAPLAVVLPESVEQVQALLSLAAARDLAIVPSGGRSGLSGGAVAAGGELVVSMERFDTISDFNPVDRTLRCGAGVITANLQAYAVERGLYYPVDFASSGSSQIGGNVATNAGGIRVIRYGMTRDQVSGLSVVTGAGELLELNGGLIKNNAGYDLRQLFIGSEGTLGIIVDVTLRLASPPPSSSVLVLGVPDMASLMPLLETFRTGADRAPLAAFEFFSEAALQKVVAAGNVSRPFARRCDYYALLEIEQVDAGGEEHAAVLVEQCMQAGLVLDGVISRNLAQARSLWRLREDISETIARWTPWKNDLSVCVSKVPDFLAAVETLLDAACPEFEVIWYGHIGDGNVHLNVLKPDDLSREEFQRRCAAVSDDLFSLVRSFGGSVSAEHGVGVLKRDYLRYTCSEAEIRLMRQLKQLFDPAGILNPGKLLPPG